MDPDFLYNSPSDPSSPPAEFKGSLPEETDTIPETVQTLTTKPIDSDFYDRLISRYESWTCVVKLTARVNQASKRFLKREVQTEQLRYEAASMLIKTTQMQCFGSTYARLKNKRPLLNSDPLLPLDPFVDFHGVIRVGGRLRRALIPFEERHPILLPPHNPLTVKIWTHFHKVAKHQKRCITNAVLRRQGFFILHAKSEVRTLLKKCVTCQKLQGRCVKQKRADLPLDRVEPFPPFLNSGIDVFGPL